MQNGAVLEGLLYLYWILCSSAAFIALQNWPGTQLFRRAVLLSAARGKTWSTRDKKLSSFSNWSVPQFYFWHFYAVGMLASTALLFWSRQNRAILLLFLFWIHVVRRLLETCCLMKYPPTAKMHAFAYLYGLSYYVVVPLSFMTPSLTGSKWMAMGITELITEMKVAVRYLASETIPFVTVHMFQGMMFFLAGSWIQFHSHYLLAHLQKQASHAEVYLIPRGGLFEYVSCPHYFGEILIYCGFSVLSGWQPLALLINTWVILNLVLGAREMHRWYIHRFTDYPKHRCALIPFLY